VLPLQHAHKSQVLRRWQPCRGDSKTVDPGKNGVNVVESGTYAYRRHGPNGRGLEQLAGQAPAGRPATADEIVDAIVFLATDRSSFVYGAKLAVDGGRTAI
jgi:NAD(P)-dependent dehydrogenase (short-subunit alcohol dehydrogenase family)